MSDPESFESAELFAMALSRCCCMPLMFEELPISADSDGCAAVSLDVDALAVSFLASVNKPRATYTDAICQHCSIYKYI